MKYIVVIGTQRSGTTVLRSLIDSHPDVQAFGEVFLYRHAHLKDCYYYFLKHLVEQDPDVVVPGPDASPALFDRYLAYLESLVPEGTKAIMFDCKYNFLDGALVTGDAYFGQPPFLLRQFRRRDFAIIHCIRLNVLATLVSGHLTAKNQVWATDDLSRIKHTTTELPTENLLRNLEHRRSEQEHYKRLLGGQVLTAVYEDILVNGRYSEGFVDALAAHCQLDNRFVAEPKFKKIAPPVSEAIENIDEVRRTLQGTEFHAFL